jgi:hypothetical protein
VPEQWNDMGDLPRTPPSYIQRLGMNHNGYHGERIEIGRVLDDCRAAAAENGWAIEELQASPKLNLLALTRPAKANPPQPLRVYISTGIHGDEPAGPLAMRALLKENAWPDGVEFCCLPCLNPAGSALHRRENADGIDLNREYLHPRAAETLAHIEWLGRKPGFDLCLCLHEDWESHGFYLYELNPDHKPSLAEAMIERISRVCPIDHSPIIEGREAHGGIIRPDLDPRSRPLWPESFFLIMHKTRLSYTLEAPSDFPLQARVDGLVESVRAAIEAMGAQHGNKAL